MNSCYNYPCTEDPYFNYYNSPIEDHVYQEPFIEPYQVSSPSQENQSYNNHSFYQYQSFEVRRHHNSETFYYKTDEEYYSLPLESPVEGKFLGPLDGFNYFKKVNHLC